MCCIVVILVFSIIWVSLVQQAVVVRPCNIECRDFEAFFLTYCCTCTIISGITIPFFPSDVKALPDKVMLTSNDFEKF